MIRTRRRLAPAAILTAVAAAGAIVAAVALNNSDATGASADVATTVMSGPPGPEGVPLEAGPLLAPATTAATGQTVDGIGCDAGEQVAYHVHTHLAIYVNGALRALPAGIGLAEPVEQATPDGPFDAASRCYYWLHVHAQDGVIHIESPTRTTYTLGQFFDLWGQPLSTGQVGPARGRVTVFVNGRRIAGSPGTIALGAHEDIQLDVGDPVVAPQRIDWAKTHL